MTAGGKIVGGFGPKPFEPILAYTRFRDGRIVPQFHPAFKPPRFKKVWDGEKYTVKVARGFWPILKKSGE